MIFLAGFLIILGFVMIFRPQLIWAITEKWKSSDATEPSTLYLWSIRFGGILCASIGLVNAVIYFF